MNDLEFYYEGSWVDAYETFGVKMHTSFVPNLLAPRSLKKFIENVSRLQHGKRIVRSNKKYEARDVSLNVVIWETNIPYRTNLEKFISFLENTDVIKLRVLDRSSDVFRLTYINSSSYAEDYWGTHGSLTIKFTECDPSKRGEDSGSSNGREEEDWDEDFTIGKSQLDIDRL